MTYSFPLETQEQKNAIVASLRNKDFQKVLTSLGSIATHIKAIDRQIDLEEAGASERKRTLLQQTLDAIEEISNDLSDQEKVALAALFSKIEFGLQSFMSKNYEEELKEKDKSTRAQRRDARNLNEYRAFSKHPYVQHYHSLQDMDDEAAMNVLRTARKELVGYEFVSLYYFLRSYERNQITPAGNRIQDRISTDPEIGLAHIYVQQGTTGGLSMFDGKGYFDSGLSILIPNISEGAEESQSPWKNETTPKIQIVSAEKTYNGLVPFLKKALRDTNGSNGWGRYSFNSDSQETFQTAVNLVANLLAFVEKPSNSESPAQDVIRAELEEFRRVAFKDVYLHRFLRQEGMPEWAKAVKASMHSSTEDNIDPRSSHYILITHGLCYALNGLDFRLYNLSDDEKIEVAKGVSSGINHLFDTMKSLASNEESNQGLAWYNTVHGFHPDMADMPETDQKRLALSDVTEMIIGCLDKRQLMEVYDKEKDDRLPQEAFDILNSIPFREIGKFLLDIGDVSNFMRMHGNFALFSKKKYAPVFDKLLQDRGYFKTPEYKFTQSPKVKFQVLTEPNGTIYFDITGASKPFQSVDQILQEKDIRVAVYSYNGMSSLQHEDPKIQTKIDEQKNRLGSFIKEWTTKTQIREEFLAATQGMDQDERLDFTLNVFEGIGVLEVLSPEERKAVVGNHDLGQLRQGFIEAVQAPKTKEPKYSWLERAGQTVASLAPWLR